MDFFEKSVDSEYKFEGKVIKLRLDTVVSPSGNTCEREIVEHPGGACVIALTADHHVLMVTQYRRPFDGLMYEIPAGKLEYGEDPLACATRELEEETGYKAKSIEFIGCYYPTPGFCNEKIYIYMATGLYPGEMKLDQDEFMEVAKESLDSLVAKVMNNEIYDSKTAIAILKANNIVNKSKSNTVGE